MFRVKVSRAHQRDVCQDVECGRDNEISFHFCGEGNHDVTEQHEGGRVGLLDSGGESRPDLRISRCQTAAVKDGADYDEACVLGKADNNST
ncbi:hypothetical protein ACLOJK_024262, partial [Asimina triloba]